MGFQKQADSRSCTVTSYLPGYTCVNQRLCSLILRETVKQLFNTGTFIVLCRYTAASDVVGSNPTDLKQGDITITNYPLSSGYAWRLGIKRMCVRIPATDTRSIFFTFICCKVVLLFAKTKNKQKRGRGWTMLKNMLTN